MPWTLPAPPRRSLESRVAYWQQLLAIPLEEPGAAVLREMATHRLFELGVPGPAGIDATPVRQEGAVL